MEYTPGCVHGERQRSFHCRVLGAPIIWVVPMRRSAWNGPSGVSLVQCIVCGPPSQGCKFMLNLQMVRWIRLISRNEPNQTTNDLVVFMINFPGRQELSLITSNWSARWFGAVRPLWLPRCHTPCRSVALRVLLPDPPSCQLLPIGCVAP